LSEDMVHVRARAVASLSPNELQAVGPVLTEFGVELKGPLRAELITGGRSNLTFRITDGEGVWVLRTPPRAGRTPSAHDVAREYRVTSALWPTDVPVARPVALCADESRIGGAFAVWEFAPGCTIQSRAQLDELSDATVATIATELVETLAALHRVDYAAVGLGDLGRSHGYAERQLKRWSSQWNLVGAPELHGLAAGLIARLSASIPAQQATSVVHVDYRIDNTLVDVADPRITAIVDWELCTIGDPVADVAMMCAYRHGAFDLIVGSPSAWTSGRLPDVEQLAAAYEAAGGVTLANWNFHLALAYFKVAVIAAGIDHRTRVGAASGRGFDTAGESVATYLRLGRERLGLGR